MPFPEGEANPFAGTSSLPDDFDAVMRDAKFGKNSNYVIKSGPNKGQMPTVLTVDLVSGDADIDQNVKGRTFTIGNGWVAMDNGTRVEREVPKAGAKQGFQDNSTLQIIVDRLLELDEAAVMAHYEATGAPPQDVRFWEGMNAHWEREDYTDFQGNKRDRLVPTTLHGWVDEVAEKPAPKKAVAKKAAAKKKAAPKPAPEDNGGGGLSDELRAQIRDIADNADDFESFVDTAFAEIDEAATDEDVAAAITDDGEGSIWAEAVAAFEAAQTK